MKKRHNWWENESNKAFGLQLIASQLQYVSWFARLDHHVLWKLKTTQPICSQLTNRNF